MPDKLLREINTKAERSAIWTSADPSYLSQGIAIPAKVDRPGNTEQKISRTLTIDNARR
jgi:hypothetical protein